MTGEQKPGGLEVVAWRWRHRCNPEWRVQIGPFHMSKGAGPLSDYTVEPLTPAEPAEARIRELERQLSEWPQTMRFCEAQWAEERGFMIDRYTAAEAKLARAVEGLERIVHWRVEMTGTPVDTEAANAWAMTFDTAATEASQTLAALQQEGE